jgi:hypothetical protein
MYIWSADLGNPIFEIVLVNGLPPNFTTKEESTYKWTKSRKPAILSGGRLLDNLSQVFGESSGVNI